MLWLDGVAGVVLALLGNGLQHAAVRPLVPREVDDGRPRADWERVPNPQTVNAPPEHPVLHVAGSLRAPLRVQTPLPTDETVSPREKRTQAPRERAREGEVEHARHRPTHTEAQLEPLRALGTRVADSINVLAALGTQIVDGKVDASRAASQRRRR